MVLPTTPRHCLFLLPLLLLSFLSQGQKPAAIPAAPRAVAFTEVRVLSMVPGQPLSAPQTVLVENDRITAMGPRLKLPKGTRIIRGRGGYLLPGLADMHVHLARGQAGELPVHQQLRLTLAAGVTTVRSMQGQPTDLALRDSIRRGQLLGPDLYLSRPLPNADSTFTPAATRELLRQYKAEGWDFIKYLSGLTPAQFQQVVELCREAGLPFAGHYYAGSVEQSAGLRSLEHFAPLLSAYRKDSAAVGGQLALVKSRGQFLCPTLSYHFLTLPGNRPAELERRHGVPQVPASLRTAWQQQVQQLDASYLTYFQNDTAKLGQARRAGPRTRQAYLRLLRRAYQQDIPLLIGPDTYAYNVPGFAMLEEMRLFAQAGLPAEAILRAATTNAAQYFGTDDWGTVQPGKRANLVLLRQNPLLSLDNLQTVVGTMCRGRWYTQQELLGGTKPGK
ncbi:amidohydrolase family protein [Hymenobacter weizhouensis]|uniref:amidohydrolase family protein n=1 Tax=Hymenobacter sp. YIM 151500-1 TaxID=2987689 RepID=UPI0022271353|nr:amidohydrolase family protein [Hymenobacter sp. YIM 151500-1]UYZ61644.1 amidohydrolase family protein [Hymenobacter sp. YIM 151500-1]